jgi:hypothetical protein
VPARGIAISGLAFGGTPRRCQSGRWHPPDATCGAPSSAGRMAARASAHRQLTRRDCLSVANEVSAASFAAGHAFEQRRGVGAPATTAEVGAAGGCRLSRPARCRHEAADARPTMHRAASSRQDPFHASQVARSAVEQLK